MSRREIFDNLYIEPPTHAYRILLLPSNKTIDVRPSDIPSAGVGQPASILDIVLGSELGISMQHDCGGLCACSTCRIIVTRGLDYCNPRHELETYMLEEDGGDLTPNDRLACQCVPTGQSDLIVIIQNPDP